MAGTTPHDTRPVDRDYLDIRLGAMEDRTDRKLAELESHITDRFAAADRHLLALGLALYVPMVGLIVAVLVK
jgi:hypothetical protein